MFFLLPSREVTNPIVNDFKQSLSQYNDLNYYTVPLCNFKNGPNDKSKDTQQESGNESSGSRPANIKKSNPAIKSKPVNVSAVLTELESDQCLLCGWNYPKGLFLDDRDSHAERCRNGYGENDKKLWAKCKSDRSVFRKKIEAMEEARNKEIEIEIEEKEQEKEREREEDQRKEKEKRKEREREVENERRREEEKERGRERMKKGNNIIKNKTSEQSGSRNRTDMEVEIDDSEYDFDIPIPKKTHHRPLPNQGGNAQKRQNPSQNIEVYDLERDDLKKVKRSPISITVPEASGNEVKPRPMIGKKSVMKAVYNPEPRNLPQYYSIDD